MRHETLSEDPDLEQAIADLLPVDVPYVRQEAVVAARARLAKRAAFGATGLSVVGERGCHLLEAAAIRSLSDVCAMLERPFGFEKFIRAIRYQRSRGCDEATFADIIVAAYDDKHEGDLSRSPHAPLVSREHAVRFLEHATRNWSRMPSLSPEDVEDVRRSLSAFVQEPADG